MQREEKQLEMSIESMISNLNELKKQLQGLLYKIEHEIDKHDWPSIQDSFAVISSQLTAISKQLSREKVPPLSSYALLPLSLSPDVDENLLRITENRIPSFNHDLVPNYLRTKLEPEIESKIQQYVQKASNLTQDNATKQVTSFNKILNNALETITKAKDDWDSDSSRTAMDQTHSMQDTHNLVALVSFGRGLKPLQSQGMSMGSNIPNMMLVNSGIRQGGPPQSPINAQNSPQPSGLPQPGSVLGKGPSSIKTNIKAQPHSYR